MKITHLFVDIGGVLLTNGWDHVSRKKAAEYFEFDFQEMEDIHRLTYDVYEEGKIDLKTYLDRVVFNKSRPFTPDDFWEFMKGESAPYMDMLELVKSLKKEKNLKITVVSNEAREINDYRIKAFHLDTFVDTFISSCFVGLRKPDVDIFRLALNVSLAKPEETIYLENNSLFVLIAQGLGIQSIQHRDYSTTKEQLEIMLK